MDGSVGEHMRSGTGGKETRTDVEDTTFVGLHHLSSPTFLWCIHTLTTTNWRTPEGLKTASLRTEVDKVMELEIIACCFSVPTVANHSWLWPTLYTAQVPQSFFADRILLVIMSMKRITLFWIVFSYFFFFYIPWMNGQHYSLCIVLIQTNGRAGKERNDSSSTTDKFWSLTFTVPKVYLMALGSGCLGEMTMMLLLSVFFVSFLNLRFTLKLIDIGSHSKSFRSAFTLLAQSLIVKWRTQLSYGAILNILSLLNHNNLTQLVRLHLICYVGMEIHRNRTKFNGVSHFKSSACVLFFHSVGLYN